MHLEVWRRHSVLRRVTFVALASTALAPGITLAQSLTVESLSMRSEAGGSITVPRVIVEGSDLSENDVRELFRNGFGPGQLMELKAESILIPEIRIQGSREDAATTVVSNVELTGISGGTARAASIDSVQSKGPGGSFKSGQATVENLDVGAIMRLAAGPGENASTEPEPIYSRLGFEGARVVTPNLTCDFAELVSEGFEARPLTRTMDEVSTAFDSAQVDDPSPEALAEMLRVQADYLTAFRLGPISLQGLDCNGTDDTGARRWIATGKVEVQAYEQPGVAPQTSIDDVSLEMGAGKLALGNFTIKPTDFTALLDLVHQAGPDMEEPGWFDANLRSIVPAFVGFSLSGAAIDVPNPDVPEERVVASVETASLTLGEHRGSIPTQIRTVVSGLSIEVPENSTQESNQTLRDLGFESIDLNLLASADWDETTESILIDELSLEMADAGALRLTGTIGNAPAGLFEADADLSMVALLGLALKEATLELTDEGLLEIAIGQAAAEQEVQAQELRQQFVQMAGPVATEFLGDSEATQRVSQAVSALLLGESSTIHLDLKATNPGGIGLPELLAVQANPAAISSLINVDLAGAASSGPGTQELQVAPVPSGAAEVDFGDDTSAWARDGECDDPRFTGPGAATAQFDEDIGRDATDCRSAFETGSVTLIDGTVAQTANAEIDFGDDTSAWARDGECDDPRFTGPGTASELVEVDRMHDATDCRAAFEAGTASLRR